MGDTNANPISVHYEVEIRKAFLDKSQSTRRVFYIEKNFIIYRDYKEVEECIDRCFEDDDVIGWTITKHTQEILSNEEKEHPYNKGD